VLVGTGVVGVVGAVDVGVGIGVCHVFK